MATSSICSVAENDYCPSPSIDLLYRIKSNYMRISEFPDNLYIFDKMLVDIDYVGVKDMEQIEADVSLPYVPEE